MQTVTKPTPSQEDTEELRKKGRWVLKPRPEILESGKDQTIAVNTESSEDGGGTTPSLDVSTKKNKESDEDVLMDELKDGTLEEEEEKTEVAASESGDGKESKKPMSLSGKLRGIGKKP